MIVYTDLDADFITTRFPETTQLVEEELRSLGEFLPHVIFGNIFNKLAASLLKQDDYATDATLRRIFDMYEELSANGDEETQALVQVTLLECLWDEKITCERALVSMGEHTKALWDCIGGYLRAP